MASPGGTGARGLAAAPGLNGANPRSEAFEVVARVACRALGVPAAFVTVSAAGRQRLVWQRGLAADEVEDACEFAERAAAGGVVLVAGPTDPPTLPAQGGEAGPAAAPRFRAGCAIRHPDGKVAGVLAVGGCAARAWGEEEAAALADLASLLRAEVLASAAALVDRLPIGFYRSTSDGALVDVNPALARMLGYPDREALLKAGLAALGVRPEERLAALQRLGPEDETYETERQVRRYDGALMWASTRLFAEREPGGAPGFVVGLVEDVTERKVAEEALWESEARLRLAVGQLPAVLWSVDRDLRFTLSLGAGLRELGLAPNEAVGTTLFEFFGTDDPELEPIAAHRRALGGESSDYRMAWEGRSYECRVEPYRGADGTVQGALGFAFDTTLRTRAEKALEQSEERLRLAAQATSDAIWDWTLATEEIWWTEGVRKLFGYGELEVEPTFEWWLRRVHPEDGDRVVASLHAALQGTADVWTDTYRFRRADGVYAHVVDRCFVVRDAAGRALRAVGAMVDVSEQRRLEARLAQAEKMEAVGRLAGGIAHDFNNLMSAVIGYADLLKRGVDDSARHQVEEIRRAGERAADLTRQLLAFSRQQLMTPRVLDLEGLVRSVEGMLRRLIGEQVRMMASARGGPFHVRADPTQIHQVILNLVVNARDAMPEGGVLRIELERAEVAEEAAERVRMAPGSYVRLAVTDTGVGMDPDTASHVFEPFFTTKELGKGTGLGLATVYGIVKQSGGYIWVTSAPGAGSCFDVYLPRTDAPLDAVAGAPPAPPAAGGGRTILLVEDEALVRDMTRAVLEEAGFRVLAASDGPAALEVARAHGGPIDLLLTDVTMPGMSGPEVAERLEAERPGTRVLYTSGHPSDVLDSGGVRRKAAHFVAKPFSADALLARVADLLRAEPDRP